MYLAELLTSACESADIIGTVNERSATTLRKFRNMLGVFIVALASSLVIAVMPNVSSANTDGIQLSQAYFVGNDPNSNGFLVMLIFDGGELQTIDPTYAYAQFLVSVDGNYRSVISAAGSNKNVMLRVEGTVTEKQRVSVTYYPSSFPLKDKGGNQVPGFNDYYISMGKDWTRPKVDSIQVTGSSVLLTLTKGLDTTRKIEAYQFSVRADTVTPSIESIHVTPYTILLKLMSPLDEKAKVTVSYMSGLTPILDSAGNSLDSFTDMPADNISISAKLKQATITGDEIRLVFDSRLQQPETPPLGAFQVKSNGRYNGLIDMQVSGEAVVLKLYVPPAPGEQLTVSYDNRAYNALETSNGMAVQSFTDVKANAGAIVPGTTEPTQPNKPDSPIPPPGGTNGNTSTPGSGPTAGGASAAIDPSHAFRSSEMSPAGMRAGVYQLPVDKLNDAFNQVLGKQSASAEVMFNIPSTESAGMVAFPLVSLLDANKKSNAASLAVTYREMTLRIPFKAMDFDWLSKRMNENGGQGYLRVEIDGPAKGIDPVLAEAVSENGASWNVQPIHYALSYTSGTIKAAMPNLTSYVSIDMSVESKLNAGRAAVVHVDKATGKLSYVPTTIKSSTDRSMVSFKTRDTGSYGIVSGNNTYADTKGHWAEAPIGQLTRKFIANGRTADEFRPNQPITRGEFAAYLARGLGLVGDPEAAKAFKDLRKHADQAFIGAALSGGIVKGLTAEVFDPNANITREQMAVMLVRSLQVIDPVRYQRNNGANVLGGFRDRGTIAAWAQSDAAMAVEQGLLTGVKPDLFSPKALATRAEAAAVIQRLLVKIGYLTA